MRDREDSTHPPDDVSEGRQEAPLQDKPDDAGSSAKASDKKPPAPYGRSRRTKEKRRDAEVEYAVKARKRSCRKNKKIQRREDKIRRERSGVCDASDNLTPDGRIYLKYFREATLVIAECSNGDMDHLISLGRLLTQFKSPTQWREQKHNWVRQFEKYKRRLKIATARGSVQKCGTP